MLRAPTSLLAPHHDAPPWSARTQDMCLPIKDSSKAM
jgi:hypothetical protein